MRREELLIRAETALRDALGKVPCITSIETLDDDRKEPDMGKKESNEMPEGAVKPRYHSRGSRGEVQPLTPPPPCPPSKKKKEQGNLSAGDVGPSLSLYRVAYIHDHKTLSLGDKVIVVETPSQLVQNLLLRVEDMTLHDLSDGYQQYVHLERIEGPKPLSRSILAKGKGCRA